MGRAPSRPAEQFAAAVAAEIRAEMGRQALTKSDLQRKISRGYTYLTERLDDRLPFDLNDLDDIGLALGVDPTTLVQRAETALRARPSVSPMRRKSNDAFAIQDEAARRDGD